MPPANSPSPTRPSTPPHPNHPSSSSYLHQLEAAISTPVPDLASTLNLTPRPLPPPPVVERYGLLGIPSIHHAELDLIMESQPPLSLNDVLDDGSDDELDRSSTAAANVDPAARGDLLRLERALENYRTARSALRAGRPSDSSEYPPVPTAGTLRAWWSEEPPDSDSETTPMTRPGVPSTAFIVDTSIRPHRDTGQRLQYARLYAERERERRHREGSSLSSHLTSRKERRRSEAFLRVRSLIRYLSQLRHTGVQGGLELARDLGLDSLYESEEANSPSDLPMHVNSLPIPQYSSWLQPGMVWNGLQSTDREPPRSASFTGPSARRERQREVFRRTLHRRRDYLGVPPDSLLDDPAQVASNNSLLNESDRWLSDLRQSTDGRWAFWSPTNPSRSAPSPRAQNQPASDHWPVNVTIHSIDYNLMTLTGTMSASHIPDKASSLHHTESEQQGLNTSMSSFFTGEIIDFRHQPLETEREGRDYSVGGLDVDARYWARLGPFREEIHKVRYLRGKSRSEYQQDSRLWDAFRKAAAAENENKELSADLNPSAASADPDAPGQAGEAEPASNKDAEDDEIMSRCLGSAKWIEEKLGREWILMRWKERCFVTPTSSASSSTSHVDNTTTILTTTSGPGVTGGSANSSGSTSWGLTISGFYYIALNRLTGEIDGLYYDPGSQPYQALRMVPEGTSKQGLTNTANAGVCEDFAKRDLHTGTSCGCGDLQCRDRPGLKKWFPSLEFR